MKSISDTLRRLQERQDLSPDETESLFGQLMDGEWGEASKAAFLMALSVKGESAAEISGAARAMRKRVVGIPHDVDGVIDTCGTGGDGKGTFNISTAAALVAAAAGAKIAKHGNRSVSSRSGSADVLEALGVRIDLQPFEAAKALNEIGIAFLFAPRLHPAMKEVMPVRRELGVRTIFNVLGPLTNPAGAKRQLIGVYARHLVELLAEVLRDLGSEHALVVHGRDGLDEITTTNTTDLAEVKDGEVKSFTLDPTDFGIERAWPDDLHGGSPQENAERLRQALAGEPGPLADITALNAGAALYVSATAETLAAGVERARNALASGAAERKLEELAGFGHKI